MLRVLGNRILVALPPLASEQDSATGYTFQPRKTSESGIILATQPDAYDAEVATRGIVVLLGEQSRPFDVEVGECVIFAPSVGEKYDQDGISYLILNESDVLAIIEPTGKEADWLARVASAVETARTQYEGVTV